MQAMRSGLPMTVHRGPGHRGKTQTNKQNKLKKNINKTKTKNKTMKPKENIT